MHPEYRMSLVGGNARNQACNAPTIKRAETVLCDDCGKVSGWSDFCDILFRVNSFWLKIIRAKYLIVFFNTILYIFQMYEQIKSNFQRSKWIFFSKQATNKKQTMRWTEHDGGKNSPNIPIDRHNSFTKPGKFDAEKTRSQIRNKESQFRLED